MRKALVTWLTAGLLLIGQAVFAQPTLQHAAKVQIKPNQSTTYDDTIRIWGGLQAGADGLVQVINADGSINVTSSTIPAGSLTFAMWDDSGCSSGQIPKYNGSAWVCDTDIVGGGGGGGTLSSISLVMPSATFDVSPGTLTADGTFTVTFDTQTAGKFFAGPVSGGAATPSWRALDVLDLPAAVVTSSDNEVITGNWRFSVPTVFGDAITPQNLIHIYKGSSQAGLSIEKGDETERWDLVANTAGLQLIEATGGLIPLTFKNNRIGIFDTTPTVGYEVDLNGDMRIDGNINVTGYVANSLVPSLNDTYNLGDLNLRWGQANITQINATIFAEATAQLFGGYSIIGESMGSTTADLASAGTVIWLNRDYSAYSFPQWIVIRSYDASGSTTPKTEYMTLTSYVASSCSGSGDTLTCSYNVTRDSSTTPLHGTDPIWPSGTPFLLLGQLGDGRIEMYANSGIPRISILKQSTAPELATELLRIGGLDGMPTMSSSPGRYGIFIGDTTTAYLKYQKNGNSGVSDANDDKLIVRGSLYATEGEFGSNASNLVTVSSEGLDVGTGAVHGGKTSYASSTDGFWIGNDGGAYKLNLGDATNYLKWNGTNLLEIAGTVTATAGTIGGWTLSSTRLSSLATAAISGGKTSYPASGADGFWLGWDSVSTKYTFRLESGGGGSYLDWDGNNLTALGGTFSSPTVTGGIIQTITNCGSAASACVKMDSTSIKWYTAIPGLIGELGTDGIVLQEQPAAGGSSPYDTRYAYRFATVGGSTRRFSGVTGTAKLTNLENISDKYADGVTAYSDAESTIKVVMYPNSANTGSLSAFSRVKLLGAGYDGDGTAFNSYFATSAEDIHIGLGRFNHSYRTNDLTTGTTSVSAGAQAKKIWMNADTKILIEGASVDMLFDSNGLAISGGNFFVDTNTLYVDNTNHRVGIGTAPSTYKLHVVGDNNTYTEYIVGGATTGQSYGLIVDAGTNTTDWSARFRSKAGAEYFAIRGDGNVGVATVSPGYTLDVNGTVNATTYRASGTVGLTTTVVVPCGTLTFTSGLLTNKGTC